MNELEVINRALFLLINGNEGTSAWLVDIAIGMANDVIYLIPLLLILMWLWGDRAHRQLAVKACLVALLALGAGQVIGLAWPHPRPFAAGLGHAWLAHAPDPSFPSDHATVFASIGLTLLCGGAPWLASLTLLAGVGVAWARIFLGIHFPMDMLGAVLVAAMAYAIVSPAWRATCDRITDVIESLYRKTLARPIAWGWVRR